jgi:hypothetical protein
VARRIPATPRVPKPSMMKEVEKQKRTEYIYCTRSKIKMGTKAQERRAYLQLPAGWPIHGEGGGENEPVDVMVSLIISHALTQLCISEFKKINLIIF